EAIEHLEAAVHLKPKIAEAFCNLGNAYAKLGQVGKSVEQYREAVRLKPDYLKAWRNLALDSAQLGLPDQAIEAARQAAVLARAQQNQELAGQIEAWLAQYRARVGK